MKKGKKYEKNFLIILVLMFIGAFALINIKNTTRSNNKGNEIKVPIDNEEIVSSTKELILKTDRLEPELHNPGQMYFENVQYLAEYLTFKEIEEVKLALQSYIQSNIDKNILDCFIDIKSIWKREGVLFFECALPNDLKISVEVKRGGDNEVVVEVREKGK